MIEPPRIGWTRTEIIWLRAALTLSAYDFLLACEDIAGMSGRQVSAVAAKARALRLFDNARAAASAPSAAPPRTVLVPYRPERPRQAVTTPPSALKPISEARKMGGR